MIIRERAINVVKLPTAISSEDHSGLMKLVASFTQVRNPRIVIDCSAVEYMGQIEIVFLLCCLEEVMKHNGDVRLAALVPAANTILQMVGVGRLFETYDSTESAVESYRIRSTSMAPLQNEGSIGTVQEAVMAA